MDNVATIKPIIIAHRGASAYLPEHSLAAKALAHAMGADYLEQDVVLSSDGIPIVLHDIYLEPTTDVAQLFPERRNGDGHYYAGDFSLQEIKQLRVHERSQEGPDGTEIAVFPDRFPLGPGLHSVPTLAEEIDFIAGLDHSRGRQTGLYIEFKAPRWHLNRGQNIARAVLDVLEEKGYSNRTQQVYLQCFDDQTLRYLRDTLKTRLPLIQLIADCSWGEHSAVDYKFLRTAQGLDYIATYADGIGPWLKQIYQGKNSSGEPVLTDLVAQAHERGLQVHPYTFRRDELPDGIVDFKELLDIFIKQERVDGLFTDFPDLAQQYIEQHLEQQGQDSR